MSLGRGVWTGIREALLGPEQASTDTASVGVSNADLQSSLSTTGAIGPADPTPASGLTPAQVGTLGSFGIGVETLDDDAQRRLGHALTRLETMAACDAGAPAACEAMGPAPVQFATSEQADGTQAVIIEEADYKLTIWTETDPLTGQQTRHLLYQDIDGTYMSGLSTESTETTAAPTPEAAPALQPEEGIASFLEGAILGDFSDNPSWSALAGQIAIGFVPYAGQTADIRDFVAAGKAVYDGKDNAGWQLLLAGVGVVPVAGDALKAVGKAALGGVAALGTTALKHSDALAELGADALKRLGDAVPPETLARLSARLGPEGLATLARGMDADTLARVTSAVDVDTLATLVAKGADGHTVRELVDGLSPTELKALSQSGSADEIAAAASRLARERLSGEAAGLRTRYLKGKSAPLGGNAAAAELTLDDGQRLSSQATSKAAPMQQPRSASEGPDPITGKGGHYEPTPHADEDWVRAPDSEYKILSDLTDQLLAKGWDGVAGKVRLYTERAPCDSCLRIIQAFESRFPGIHVEVYYDFTVSGAPL